MDNEGFLASETEQAKQNTKHSSKKAIITDETVYFCKEYFGAWTTFLTLWHMPLELRHFICPQKHQKYTQKIVLSYNQNENHRFRTCPYLQADLLDFLINISCYCFHFCLVQLLLHRIYSLFNIFRVLHMKLFLIYFFNHFNVHRKLNCIWH